MDTYDNIPPMQIVLRECPAKYSDDLLNIRNDGNNVRVIHDITKKTERKIITFPKF